MKTDNEEQQEELIVVYMIVVGPTGVKSLIPIQCPKQDYLTGITMYRQLQKNGRKYRR